VPLLSIFGIMCRHKSEMIELPESQKGPAGQACLMASLTSGVFW